MSSLGRQNRPAGGVGVGSVPSRSFVQEEEGDADSEDEINQTDAATHKHQSSGWSAPIPMASLMLLPMHKVGWLDLFNGESGEWLHMWFVLRGTVLAHFKDSEAALVSKTASGWVLRH